MKFLILSSALLILPFDPWATGPDFSEFSADFVTGYTSLKIPQLALSYVSNVKNIPAPDSIQKQIDFFKSIREKLADFNPEKLSPAQRLDYGIIQYEANLNLQRLDLEQNWARHPPDTVSAKGIFTIPNGKAWYTYYLKRWVSDDVTPDQIYKFGLDEIAGVQKHIEDIRLRVGMTSDAFYKHLNDTSFFINDPLVIQQSFERTKSIVMENLHNIFDTTEILDLKIARGTEPALAQTPGYYDNNSRTFYYNLFNKPYNRRQIDWLFLHEAVPGHHYQFSIASHVTASPVQNLFFYSGYVEGWGAYVEELGQELGLYKTPYDELGKWEWDIVRSVRVPLDVGLNYYGWTDQQALDFWKKNIRGQDDIAMREIARMRRWPAQVITYKYGARQILHWKEVMQRTQGKSFDIKKFHDQYLNQGALPLSMMKNTVFEGV
jgi:uncharacterized protein (DUF885 family)